MGRSWAEGGWSTLVPGILRDWRMLGDNTAKGVLFILQQKLDAWEKWNILAEPIPKLQMLKLLET